MNDRMMAKKNLFKGMKDYAKHSSLEDLKDNYGPQEPESEEVPGAESEEMVPDGQTIDHNEPQMGEPEPDGDEQMKAGEDSGVKVTIEGVSPSIIEKIIKEKMNMVE